MKRSDFSVNVCGIPSTEDVSSSSDNVCTANKEISDFDIKFLKPSMVSVFCKRRNHSC